MSGQESSVLGQSVESREWSAVAGVTASQWQKAAGHEACCSERMCALLSEGGEKERKPQKSCSNLANYFFLLLRKELPVGRGGLVHSENWKGIETNVFSGFGK